MREEQTGLPHSKTTGGIEGGVGEGEAGVRVRRRRLGRDAVVEIAQVNFSQRARSHSHTPPKCCPRFPSRY